MLTFSKTCCSTCSSYCRVNYLGVTECINNSLSNENLVTYGTVLTFSKTGCSTCSSYCRVNYLGMTECINNLLCNGCIVTSCTVRAFGKTGFGTSGINRRVNYDVVAESLNLIATFGSIAVQYGIVRTALFIIAYIGTEVNITSSAVPICQATICGTGFLNLSYLIKGMTICIDSLLCNENLVTYGTVLTFGLTCGYTSSSYCRVNYHGVNVSNNTECAVAIVGTIKCTVLTELRNIGSECTTGNNESCLSILVSLVHINVAVDETTLNITCTTYDTLIAGKVMVPVVDVKCCIILGFTVVYDITTYESECAVNTNGNLLLCGDSTVTYESNILVDTNVEERITCVIVIVICGRNCLAVKINSEATNNLAVVSGLNIDIFRNCDVRKKNYCIAVLCCINCSLKCFIFYVTDLCYCNERGNKVAIFGSATAVCTGVNCVTLSIKCRINYLTGYHIVTESVNNNCISALLLATYGTVNYVIIRSCNCTCGGSFVFHYCLTGCTFASIFAISTITEVIIIFVYVTKSLAFSCFASGTGLGCGTSCIYPFMTKSCLYHCTTYGTSLICGTSSCRACGVTVCLDCFGVAVITNRTCKGLNTCLSTCRIGSYRTYIIMIFSFTKCFLTLGVLTLRASLVRCVACFSTGRILACYVNKGVTESRLNFCRTYSTLLCSCTCRSCTGSMTGCGDFCSTYYLVTIVTSNGCRTCYCTSCIYGSSCGVSVGALGFSTNRNLLVNLKCRLRCR